jgi:hypothetical protein
VGLIGERPIEGLRLETTDSALPCGWQHMQVGFNIVKIGSTIVSIYIYLCI